MKVINSEIICKGKFLKLKREYTDRGIWESVDFGGHTKSAVVIALTPQNEVLLEKHYRVPVRKYVIELPAGLVDDESPEECARRELLEETGYEAKELIYLFKGVICQGLTEMESYYFYAPNAVLKGEQKLEPSEEIEILKVPWKNLDNFLFNLPEDTILSSNVLSVVYALKRYLEKY
jgi:ADP-ribose pyrophosphatase